jgi:hypothetical protein
MMKRLIAFTIAGVALGAHAQAQCFPDGNGGQVCTSGTEFFCAPPLEAVCRPGLPETSANCYCRWPQGPAKCSAMVEFQLGTPAAVMVTKINQCSTDELRAAMLVFLARLALGTDAPR